MARKRKKRKAKVVKMKQKFSPEKYIVEAARKLPVKAAYISDNMFESGIGVALVLREKKNKELLIGIYLVDIYACGVKDTFYKFIDGYHLDDFFDRYRKIDIEFEEYDPNYVFNLIYGAVKYAKDIGLNPHKDFKLTSYILDDIDDIEYEEIEFGKDGKPLYVEGEKDNTKQIISILDKTIGRKNYDYILSVDFEDEYIPDEDNEAYIDELLDEFSQEELTVYLYYVNFAVSAFELFDYDVEKLKKKFLKAPLNLAASVFSEIFDSEHDNDLNISEEVIKERSILNSIILENIILENGIDFLEDEFFISSFKRNPKDILGRINNTIYLLNAKNRLPLLFDYIKIIIFEINKEYPNNKIDITNPLKFYKEFNNSFKDSDNIFDISLTYIIDYLNNYEYHFGEITEDMIVIKD